MPFNFDLTAIITIGVVAAGFFWRLLSRVEKKLDQVVDNMITKEECSGYRGEMGATFNSHFHTPDGDLAILRRVDGQIHQNPKAVPGGRYLRLPKGPGKYVGTPVQNP